MGIEQDACAFDAHIILIWNEVIMGMEQELKRLDYRMQWEADFLAYLKKLEEKKPVIYAGDLNVAHEEIDLKNPKTNRGNAGFTDEERSCFSKVLENGFIDTFRYFYPEQTGIYSWWSYRFQARAKNAGRLSGSSHWNFYKKRKVPCRESAQEASWSLCRCR